MVQIQIIHYVKHANMACETAQTSGNDATLNIIYKWILCEVVKAGEG